MIARDEVFQSVDKILTKAKVEYYRDVSIDGIPADFAIAAKNGRVIVVETKNWKNVSKDLLEDAERQAKLFETVGGADRAYVVVRELPAKYADATHVVTIASLLPALELELQSKRKVKPKIGRTAKTVKKTVFAAMPFDAHYDDVHAVAMAYAADSVGAKCVRVDREMFSGDIKATIDKMIKEAVAVIIDLSDAKPNVLYEAGFAHALNKIVIHICSTPLKKLPFDVAQWNTLSYNQGQTHAFRDTLAKNLKAVLQKRRRSRSK